MFLRKLCYETAKKERAGGGPLPERAERSEKKQRTGCCCSVPTPFLSPNIDRPGSTCTREKSHLFRKPLFSRPFSPFSAAVPLNSHLLSVFTRLVCVSFKTRTRQKISFCPLPSLIVARFCRTVFVAVFTIISTRRREAAKGTKFFFFLVFPIFPSQFKTSGSVEM